MNFGFMITRVSNNHWWSVIVHGNLKYENDHIRNHHEYETQQRVTNKNESLHPDLLGYNC